MSEAKLTNKELWRVFRHQLTIRGANNYERQQNAGFTEAMMSLKNIMMIRKKKRKHMQDTWSIF